MIYSELQEEIQFLLNLKNTTETVIRFPDLIIKRSLISLCGLINIETAGASLEKKIKKKSHNNHGIIVSTPNLACICQKDACTISINLAATLNNIKKNITVTIETCFPYVEMAK